MEEKLKEIKDKAKTHADLFSVMQDLMAVMKTCSSLKKILQDGSKDGVLIQNLWTAALIRYARCFASGKRFKLNISLLKNLEGEPVKVHELYINLRNKHIAHSVNPFEQYEDGIIIDDKQKKVVAVSTLGMTLIALEEKGIHQLGLLSNVFYKEAKRQYDIITEQMLSLLSQIPLEILSTKKPLRIYAPGSEDAHVAREVFITKDKKS